jgi:hypothetical protein
MIQKIRIDGKRLQRRTIQKSSAEARDRLLPRLMGGEMDVKTQIK